MQVAYETGSLLSLKHLEKMSTWVSTQKQWEHDILAFNEKRKAAQMQGKQRTLMTVSDCQSHNGK